ncbi:hypothetical protein ACH5RR_000157 [Cinchona calisaya]|uniref:Malectin-like domain-containing protein n=1 Tax=Cinchona calisaya TaxID=153742 RepID=A0ABD3B015_9GENT
MSNFITPLLLLLSFFTTLVSSTSPFSPIDHYLINCGSHNPTTTDLDHRIFTGDDDSSTTNSASQFLTITPSSTRTIPCANSDPSPISSPLYRTARAFNRPFKYTFRIQDRRTTHHLVRLHFHPFFNNSSFFDFSLAKFHVLANGFLLLHDFSIENNYQKVGGVIIKEYMIRVGDSDKLEISFVPLKRSNFAFVNAIEVISAPKDLIADVAQFVSSERNERVDGLLKNGFETVYRVNVGGPKVTPFNDSLWRTWVPDDEYLKKSGDDGLFDVHFGGWIQYRVGGASREVGPDNVYNSARVIKSLNGSIPKSNITWLFPGIEGYKYLVRLHFCDIASVVANLLYFNVYVNGNLAYENLDLSAMTNMLLASPFYADFVVEGSDSAFLTVSVGPSNLSFPNAVDAILNGVEVFKINNSMGSFDGQICAQSVMKSWKRGNVGVVVPLLAAVFLLLTASVVVQRRRCGLGDKVGWSRLPVDVSEVNLKYGSQQSAGKL